LFVAPDGGEIKPTSRARKDGTKGTKISPAAKKFGSAYGRAKDMAEERIFVPFRGQNGLKSYTSGSREIFSLSSKKTRLCFQPARIGPDFFHGPARCVADQITRVANLDDGVVMRTGRFQAKSKSPRKKCRPAASGPQRSTSSASCARKFCGRGPS